MWLYLSTCYITLWVWLSLAKRNHLLYVITGHLIHERLKAVTHVRDSEIKRFTFNPYIAHKSGNHLRELFQIICAFLLTFYQLGLLAYCNLHL